MFENQFVIVECIKGKHIPAGNFSSNTRILYYHVKQHVKMNTHKNEAAWSAFIVHIE